MTFRLLLPLVLLLLSAAGCTRVEPAQTPVVARSASAFSLWRSRVADRFTRDEWKEFDAVLQELRLQIMGDRAATGSEAIEAELHRRIDGHTFQAVLKRGLEAKQLRLDGMRVGLQQALETNAWLVTKPGDGGSAQYLAELRARQQQRLAGVLGELAATDARLVALGGNALPPSRAAAAPATSPAPLARAEARRQITAMIEESRTSAQMIHGLWPLQIDRDGASMTEEERADFQSQRAAAEADGQVAIPVRLRGRWWIFVAKPATPEFPTFVTENLTAVDRQEITAQWLELQAELWARRSAAKSL